MIEDVRQRVVLRADADRTIGMGHFVRCLALAQMLCENFDCLFATRNPSSYQAAEVEKVCRLLGLPEENADDIFLEGLAPHDIVVLDNYYFKEDFQRKVKQRARSLVYIDDLHDQHYVADVVINHGLEDRNLYQAEPYTRFCLGLSWAMLRTPFLQKFCRKSSLHNDIRNIIICMGGSDPFNLSGKVLSILQESGLKLEKIVVLGGANTQMMDTSELNIEVMSGLNAEEIRNLLLWADMGFFSASTICVEALSMHLPSVVGYYVNNQEGFYDYISQTPWVKGVGNWLEVRNLSGEDLNRFIPDFTGLKMEGIKERYVQLFKEL